MAQNQNTKGITGKGFTKNFLNLMAQLEKFCCGSNNLFKINVANSDCISLSGTGTVADPIVASPIISDAVGNTLQCTDDGLFADTDGVQSIVAGDGIDVDATDPKHPIVSAFATSSVLKSILDKHPLTYFELPRNFDTDDVFAVTTAGALGSSSPIAVGSYDQYTVGAGNQTSTLTFNDFLITDSFTKIVFTVQASALGTTPYIGIRVTEAAGYNRLITGNNSVSIYFKPSIPSIEGKIATGTYPAGFDYNDGGSPFVINNNDIIEMTLQRHIHDKIGWDVTVINKTTGNFISRKAFGVQPSNTFNSAATVGFILADGTYTILGYDVIAQEGEGTKIALIGDANATNYNTVFPNTVINKIDSQIFYRTVVLGGGFTDVRGMVRATIPEILKLKPASVVYMASQEFATLWFQPLNPNEALFLASFKAISDAIKSYDGILIVPKWNVATFPSFAGAPITAWNLWVTTNQATYGYQILDMSAIPLNADGSGFFIGFPSTTAVANAIVAFAQSLSII